MEDRLDLSGTPAEVYERHNLPRVFLPWGRVLVEAAPPKAGERVLDLGCGTGIIARLVEDLVGPTGSVVGVDLNPDMIAKARTTSSKVTWQEANATSLPFPDQSFDRVYAQQVIQYVPDRAQVLREAKRVLVAGGHLVASIWGEISKAPGYAAIERALVSRLGDKGKLAPFALNDPNEILNLFKAAGFKDVKVRAETRTMDWPSGEALVRITAAAAPGMVAPLAAQGEAAMQAICGEVEADLAKCRDATGAVRFPILSHLVIARA